MVFHHHFQLLAAHLSGDIPTKYSQTHGTNIPPLNQILEFPLNMAKFVVNFPINSILVNSNSSLI